MSIKKKSLPVFKILIVVKVVLVLIGCGGSSSNGSSSLLQGCCTAMSSLNSYRVKGSMHLVAEALPPAPGRSLAPKQFFMHITLEEEASNLDGEWRYHYVNDIREGVEGSEITSHRIEGWTIGGNHYTYSQEEGWKREDLGVYEIQNLSTHFLGLEQMRLISEKAKDVKLELEDQDTITLSFWLGEEYLRPLLENVVQRSEERGEPIPAEWVVEAEKTLTEMRLDVCFRVRKDSMLLERCEVKFKAGEITVNIVLDPYDYNCSVEVSLPEEAQKALGV